MRKKNKKAGEKRPVAVTVTSIVIVILFFIRVYQAVTPLVGAKFYQYGFSLPIFWNGNLTEYGKTVLVSFAYLLFAICLVIVLIGFLRRKKWTWVFLMTWVGISLIVSLIDYFYLREPNYMIMASNVVIAFALNQSDVQRIFGIRSDSGEEII